MTTTMDDAAREAAKVLTALSPVEETGGFIIKKKEQEEYEFVPVTNRIRGKGGACAFYDADRADFGVKVLQRHQDGFKPVASMHTHPAFSNSPSVIDLTRLFRSFPVNYIYSIEQRSLARYDLKPSNVKLEKGVETAPAFEDEHTRLGVQLAMSDKWLWQKTQL